MKSEYDSSNPYEVGDVSSFIGTDPEEELIYEYLPAVKLMMYEGMISL